MSRVFVLEPLKFDTKEAERFGKVVIVYDKDIIRPNVWSQTYGEHLLERLTVKFRFEPEEDYFLAAGKMVPVSLAISYIAVEYGIVRLLLFSASTGQYSPRLIGERYEE